MDDPMFSIHNLLHGYIQELADGRFAENSETEILNKGDKEKKKITVEETEAEKMRPGKATGPDDVVADLWKSKYWYPAEWLAKFFNQVVAEKKVPECWRQSTTIPIWK
ncbi:unnamed protein product [Heligmosomoides polygyrus]|uniref:Ovule protein n=1 Tax=Heligmosomoides polygyrus TaxID=6339 RepID=A0A183FQI8_HELPZ|nr:unnamed protein product [Heligmosomoides polygyrus]